MAMTARKASAPGFFWREPKSHTHFIKYRNWKEPNNDGWKIQMALERSAIEYDKSVSDSAFLNAETHFARLELELKDLASLHASVAEVGEESPSEASINAVLPILKLLKQAHVIPESLIPAADGGVAIVLAPSGKARAYFQILNDGDRSLILYDTSGTVLVHDVSDLESPSSRDRYVEALTSHLKAGELATAY